MTERDRQTAQPPPDDPHTHRENGLTRRHFSLDSSGLLLLCGGIGRLAQLVERLVYTEIVGGSSPSSPTTKPIEKRHSWGMG